MKILLSYTFDYMKRNRRGSIAIMVAILMTSTMLSALCAYLYNIYADNLSLVLKETGNWHGELFDSTLGSDLPVIEGFESVESVMIKGDWKTAQIEDQRRDYLVWRDANTAYWESMPEGDSVMGILEGRIPAAAGEIALSKQYFESHPELRIGDSITLPTGDRVAKDGTLIAPNARSKPGERFVQTGTATLQVVGKADVTTSSTVPAYTALGYLDPADIRPEDELTVYFRFHNIRDTYRELPKIAEAVGYEKDEYGNYLLRYNVPYLSRMAVLSPDQDGLLPKLMASQMPLMFAVMSLFVVSLFVLIIHNAFALSSSARLTQLGIFASVGATPKQIKRSVILEALLLTVIPLPFGLLLGQSSVFLFMDYANQTTKSEYQILFRIGWQSVVPAILLTVFTVWWASLIPARRIARLSPILAIRQGGAETLKKPGRYSLGKVFGLTGELAGNALRARKKSYRTAAVSLTLSFLTLASFLCITSASTASKAVYKSDEKLWADQDIMLTLSNVSTKEDFQLIDQTVKGLEQVSSARWFRSLNTALWQPEDGFSEEFEAKGGFEQVEKKLFGAQVPLLREGSRRVGTQILGLDDVLFSDYCESLSIDPAVFYEEDGLRGILYHTVNDVTTSTKRHPAAIPFLNVETGDTMTLTEKTRDSDEGEYTFDIEVGAIAEQKPAIGSTAVGVRYSVMMILPMSRVEQLGERFTDSNILRVQGVIEVSNKTRITETRNRVEQICESYFGSGDYSMLDEDEYYESEGLSEVTAALLFGFVSVLLAVIGLSNAWATVRGTMNARRREFAMLRSVGLPPRGLRRMLLLEAVMFGVSPILASLPIVLAMQLVFLNINEVTFLEWLPYAPWLTIAVYVICVLGIITAAYAVGGRLLMKENIIEAIKEDVL